MRALIRDYKDSPEWKALAPKTQVGYARVLDYMRSIGDFKAANVRRQYVIRMRNKIGSNSRTQDLFVQAVSRMFGIGMDRLHRSQSCRIARLNEREEYLPQDERSRAGRSHRCLPPAR